MYLYTSPDFRVSVTEIDCAEKLLVYLRTSPNFRVSVTEIDCAEKLLVYLRTSPDFKVSVTEIVGRPTRVRLLLLRILDL